MLDSKDVMNTKGLAKIATGISAGIGSLYLAALPAFAAVNLCDNANTQGVNASFLCTVSVDTLVSRGLNLILFVAFVAALGFLIYGGIRWIISGGDKENTAKAKGTVTAALIGLVIVIGSWILLNVIFTFFGGGSVTNLVFPKLP